MKLITNLLLMISAIFLFVLIGGLGIITTIVLMFFKDHRKFFNIKSDYPFGIAYGIDMLGNIICGDLFNIILTKKGNYKFGRNQETISSAIGKNLRDNKLTQVGLLLNKFLNLFEKNHSLKSIQEFEEKNVNF